MEPLLLKPDEAAAAIGVSRARVYELIAARKIPSIRIAGGRSVRVPVAALREWIDAQLAAAKAAEGETGSA